MSLVWGSRHCKQHKMTAERAKMAFGEKMHVGRDSADVMYVYIYIYIYTHTRHIYIYIYIYICIIVSVIIINVIYVYMYMCIYIYIYIHIYVIIYNDSYVYRYRYIHIHVCIHTYSHARPIFKLRTVRPRIFESEFRNHCAKELVRALRKPTSFV